MIKRSKLVRIGNSRGIRIPQAMIQRAGFSEDVLIEEKNGGIFVHSAEKQKLSWDETYSQMAASEEDWSDWTEMDIENLHEDQSV